MSDDPQAVAIAARYAKRDAAADAKRYSLFDAVALEAAHERQRVMLQLLRQQGWSTLAGRDLLEVGCGSGNHLLEWLRIGAEAHRLQGIELLPARLDEARRRLPAAAKLWPGDARAVPIAAASLDLVAQFTVFSSILDDATQQDLAEAMWRWLKPGGLLLWYDFVVDNPRNPDVRAVSLRRVRELFAGANAVVRSLTLAPPLARRLPRPVRKVLHTVPLLRTHRMVMLRKSL